MMQSILAFDKVGQTGLASSGWVNPSKNCFIRPSSKWDDPNMFSDCLNDRNIMVESIIHFEKFRVTTT
jgi:hypothetical protein